MAFGIDAELATILAILFAAVFGVYLFIRRIIRSFRAGLEQGRD